MDTVVSLEVVDSAAAEVVVEPVTGGAVVVDDDDGVQALSTSANTAAKKKRDLTDSKATGPMGQLGQSTRPVNSANQVAWNNM